MAAKVGSRSAVIRERIGYYGRGFNKLKVAGLDGCRRSSDIVQGIRAIVTKYGLFPFADWEDELLVVDEMSRSFEIGFGHPRQEDAFVVEFYVDATEVNSDPTSWAVPRSHIRTTDMPATCLRFAADALRKCTQEHSCYAVGNGTSPKRLLYLGAPEAAHDTTLVDHTSFATSAAPCYIALIYCWGPASTFESKMLCMTQDNLKEMSRGIQLSQLPAVFQDAVTTTRYLGLQYTWIDALCIAQGDPQEWAEESLKMADYYSNAFVTIVPAASSNCNKSFLDVDRYRKHREGTELHRFNATEPTQNTFVRPCIDDLYLRSSDDRIRFPERGSTVSEDGNTTVGNDEGLEDGLQAACYDWRQTFHLSKEISSTDLRDIWYKTLTEYVGRELTSAGDRLVAIAGLASRLRANTREGNQYLAGMWTDTFIADLSWRRCKRLENGEKAEVIRCEAPSWSWASVPGEVSWVPWHTYHGSDHDYHTRLLSAQVSVGPGGGLGHVKTGQVVLEGPSLHVRLTADRTFELVTAQSEGDTLLFAALSKSARRRLSWDQPADESPVQLREIRVRDLRSPDQRAALREIYGAGNMHGINSIFDLLLLHSFRPRDDPGITKHLSTFFLILSRTEATDEQYYRTGVWETHVNAHSARTQQTERHLPEEVRQRLGRLPKKTFVVV
ncbi:hypothetical protein H2200_004881 [Cladophialophora chaetospira]|uniref:Heterokaryon incompatibility domain-containing protein n=1 Tax=Cladophialophora chaetospira TaxID=386627 RepID=A0AA38XE06_9EURO|nr:hypothetical protein H2200_004881 [Cladophialophora chaetospira]